MKILILKPTKKPASKFYWKPGAQPEVNDEFGKRLIRKGHAKEIKPFDTIAKLEVAATVQRAPKSITDKKK